MKPRFFIHLFLGLVSANIFADSDTDYSSRRPIILEISTGGGEPRIVYEDVVGLRQKNENDPGIPTLTLNPSTLKKPPEFHNSLEAHQKYFSRITNLTNLDQLAVRDEVAKTLSEIPCSPNSKPTLTFRVTEQHDMQDYYKIKTPWVAWKISFINCLMDEKGETMVNGSIADACLHPNHSSPHMSAIDYDSLLIVLKNCRDAIQKKVHDDNLLEKWKAAMTAKPNETSP